MSKSNPVVAAKPAAAPKPGVAGRPLAPQVNLDTALSGYDDSAERWLIQKDKLDFGPFRLSEVKSQIEKGQIKGEHTIIDMENGERRRVQEHPVLRDFVAKVEGHLETRARAEADLAAERSHKHRVTLLLGMMAAVLAIGAGAVVYYMSRKPNEKERIVYRERDVEELFKGIEISMKVEPPPPKKKTGTGHSKGSTKGGSGELSDVTNLGDANGEGGDETLDAGVVQKVMTSNFRSLTGCIYEERKRNPSLKNVDMDFAIKGSGSVSGVKVNGAKDTVFANCMYSKMQSIAFPKFNGAHTRASFSLSLK